MPVLGTHGGGWGFGDRELERRGDVGCWSGKFLSGDRKLERRGDVGCWSGKFLSKTGEEFLWLGLTRGG